MFYIQHPVNQKFVKFSDQYGSEKYFTVTDPLKASRCETKEAANQVLEKHIKALEDSIETVEDIIQELSVVDMRMRECERSLRCMVKKLNTVKSFKVVFKDLCVYFNPRVKKQPFKFTNISPLSKCCNSCGVYILQNMCYAFGRYSICTLCMERLSGIPNKYAEEFRQEYPDLYQQYSSLLFSSMLDQL